MAWSAAGVQTGTDTDLSGLTSVTGTTTLTVGSGLDQRTIYRVSATLLTIEGTLTMNPEQEEIIFVAGTILISTGTFNIGAAITRGGYTRYPYGTALHFSQSESWSGTGNMEINAAGTWNWYGGIIYTGGGSFNYAAGSTVHLYSQNCVLIRTSDPTEAQSQIRSSTVNYDQDGFIDIGALDDQDWFSWIGLWNTFNGYFPIHKKSALSGSGSSSNALYNTQDYNAAGGNNDDSVFWNLKQMEFQNPVLGSALKFTGLSASATANRGVYTSTCDLTVTILDDVGVGIVGGMYFLRDYDNGDRQNDTITPDLVNFVADRTYVEVAGVGGVCASERVLTMAVARVTGGVKGTADAGLNKHDQRSKADDVSDIFDFGIHAYGYLKTVANNVALLGAGGVQYSRVLFDDTNITEATQATVAAYTTLDNLNEVYDYGSYWHLDDAGGLNIEIPSLAEFLIPCAGPDLRFRAVDVVIDSGATNQFDFAANTVTIKPTTVLSASLVKNTIQTTGDIIFETASVGTGLTLEGDVYLFAEQDISDCTIIGNLYIDTGVDSALDFTNVSVSGDIFNDATGNTLTISALGTSIFTAGDPGTGNGETEIIKTVPMKVTVKDITSGDPLEGARVYIRAALGGDLSGGSAVAITRAGAVATVTDTAHGMLTGEIVTILGANENEYNGSKSITVLTVNTYTYPIAGSPASPATGAVTAAAQLLNQLTDALGEVSKIQRYTNDQPVTGSVRKATP